MMKKIKFILLSIGVWCALLSQKVFATNMLTTPMKIRSVKDSIGTMILKMGLLIGIPVIVLITIIVIVCVVINKNKKNNK